MHEKFIRIEATLERLGNPHKGIHFVHVTGSNGKGSTCAMTASILQESGITTGLFTSPHIHKWNERIKVNGIDISDEDLESLGNQVDAICEELKIGFSEMERFFIIALMYFKKMKIDIGVIEVGIGGRIDATNIIDGIVSVITHIELEHTHILGKSLEEIAYDKAGIIKEGALCITAETNSQLINIFAEEAKKKNATLLVIEDDDVELISQSQSGHVFNFMKYFNLELSLLGDHQLKNAALAISVIDALNNRVLSNQGKNIDAYLIKQGLKNVTWPLRMEIIKSEKHTILLDGAHTLKAVKSVFNTINQFWGNTKKIAIIGFSEGKNYEEILDYLVNQIDVCIVTKAEYKGISEEEIAEYICGKVDELYVENNVPNAMQRGVEIGNSNNLILVLGGLYLGAEAREWLNTTYLN